MKQFAFRYNDAVQFENDLCAFGDKGFAQDRMLFYIYSEILEKSA